MRGIQPKRLFTVVKRVILNSLYIVVLCRVEHLVNKVTELQETLQRFVTKSNGESRSLRSATESEKN